jgi:hypothetical protein
MGGAKVRSPYRRAKLYHLAGVGGGKQNRTNSASSAADPSQVVTHRAPIGRTNPFFQEAPPEGQVYPPSNDRPALPKSSATKNPALPKSSGLSSSPAPEHQQELSE